MLRVMSIRDEKPYLTKGKIYKVLEERGDLFDIIDDTGIRIHVYRWRFKILDCNICVERNCNSCILNKEI